MKQARAKDLIDFELLGLVSASKPPKLAWTLNTCCQMALVRSEPINLTSKEGILISPTVYYSETDYTMFWLFPNKTVQLDGYKNFLIKSLKAFDYFLIIKDQTEHAVEDLSELLDVCPMIDYYSKLDPLRINGIEVFIF